MERSILGFHRDEEDYWVAELECGHSQHVRHNPPFENRPWTTTQEGRQSKLGQQLRYLNCDRFELPEGFQAYKRTPEFDAASIPDGLRKAHSTKRRVWAKVHVWEGQLRYTVHAPLNQEFILEPENDGIIVPELLHHVEPLGAVRFFVEFYKYAPE
jgi:tellurite methyltransferase